MNVHASRSEFSLIKFDLGYPSEISDQAARIFKETLSHDRVTINMSVPNKHETLAVYIEDILMKLWDNAFLTFL